MDHPNTLSDFTVKKGVVTLGTVMYTIDLLCIFDVAYVDRHAYVEPNIASAAAAAIVSQILGHYSLLSFTPFSAITTTLAFSHTWLPTPVSPRFNH